MKNLIFYFASLGVLSLFLFCNSVQAQNTLTVDCKKLSSDKGEVWVAVYSSDGEWMKKAYSGKSGNISNNESVVVFENLPNGTYAVSAFHDKNENKKLDTNAIGIPKEDYSFSNNPLAMFGPPSFSKSSFSLNGNKRITLNFN